MGARAHGTGGPNEWNPVDLANGETSSCVISVGTVVLRLSSCENARFRPRKLDTFVGWSGGGQSQARQAHMYLYFCAKVEVLMCCSLPG